MRSFLDESIQVRLSPLTEGRGLKLCRENCTESVDDVAPHGGAWIEIYSLIILFNSD